MPISGKSRDVVRLEYARAAAELSKAWRNDVGRLQATLPRGGGMNKAVDDRQVECTRQSFIALREAYIRAHERENAELTIADIEDITRRMEDAVRAQLKAAPNSRLER